MKIGWVKDSISVTVFFDFLILILMFFFNVAFIMLLILASSSAGKYTWLSEYVGELNGYVMLALPVFAFYPFFNHRSQNMADGFIFVNSDSIQLFRKVCFPLEPLKLRHL